MLKLGNRKKVCSSFAAFGVSWDTIKPDITILEYDSLIKTTCGNGGWIALLAGTS